MEIILHESEVPEDCGEFFEPIEMDTPTSVFTISAEPVSLAHFASFPSELVRRCLQAGTSDGGCCPRCGAPFAPMVEERQLRRRRPRDRTARHEAGNGVGSCGNTVAGVETNIVGYKPTCECGEVEPLPCLVLDCFAGTGRTLQTAVWMGRDAVGIELNPEYVAMAKQLIREPPGWWLKRRGKSRGKGYNKTGAGFGLLEDGE